MKSFKEILGKVANQHDIVEKDLSEEKKKEFEQFCDLSDELAAKTADEHFTEGVKIGILLGIEVCN